MNIYERINEVCEKYSNEVAYVDFDDDGRSIEITYSEVKEEIELYISKFKNMKLKQRSIIGINIQRNHRLCSLLAAISYLDFVYVPLDISFPENYIEIAKNQIGIDALLTNCYKFFYMIIFKYSKKTKASIINDAVLNLHFDDTLIDSSINTTLVTSKGNPKYV